MRKKLWGILCLLLWPALVMAGQFSEDLPRHLRRWEGLHLSVYMDGDRKAVGYGHRITSEDSEFLQSLPVGAEVSRTLAETILYQDLDRLVSRGLVSIKREIGGGYPQSVYDVMGSLVYNMGLASLRRSLFYRTFKRGDYRMAILLLPFTASRAAGLKDRRREEQRMLVRDYEFSSNRFRKNK